MKRALIVRPSSLGDIVHALPIVHDITHHHPGIAIDWVAEEPFVPLVALNPGIDRVIPVALRRWRHRAMAAPTWRELGSFRRALGRDRYDVVLDLQEQMKGALIAWFARGPVHGPDRASIREPAATLLYKHRYSVNPQQHLIDRCRELASKAFCYDVEGPPRFDIAPLPFVDAPTSPYVVFIHATSRDDKLWPEAHWHRLIEHFTQNGAMVVLPWGSVAEAERSRRLAADNASIWVPPRLDLHDIAGLLASADLACGVDTGLVHLAAAVGTPTISLFVATDPNLAGVARANAFSRDLGGIGLVPSPEQVIAVAGELLANERCC